MTTQRIKRVVLQGFRRAVTSRVGGALSALEVGDRVTVLHGKYQWCNGVIRRYDWVHGVYHVHLNSGRGQKSYTREWLRRKVN